MIWRHCPDLALAGTPRYSGAAAKGIRRPLLEIYMNNTVYRVLFVWVKKR